MQRRRSNLVVILAASGLLCVPAAAHAGGALSKVVGGMKQQTRSSGNGNNGSSDGGGSTDQPEPSRDHRADGHGSGYWHDPHRAYDPAPVYLMGPPYPTGGAGTDVAFYAGLQSVDDSDGAGFISLRASHGDLGIVLEESRYWERIRTPDGMDLLTMDVWGIGMTYRVAQSVAGDTAVWLRGGLAGANSDGLAVLGAYGGAEVAHNINENIGLDASVRGIAYQDDIHGLEARAGIAAAVLRISYRVLKFDVGPALRGPEFGLAFGF
jgi:hypothetical protein